MIANFGYLPVCVLVWYMAKRYTKPRLIITTITLLFFFQRLVSTKLLADYSSLYVAYKIGLDKDILLFFRYFGIIPLILFFAAGICLLFSKSQRCDAAFLMIWSVLCFCLFVRVQTHGQQHLLMYAPAFMCMIILVSGRLEANLHGSKQYTTALTAAGMFAHSVAFTVHPAHTASVATGTEKTDYAAVLQLVSAEKIRRHDRGRAAAIS